MKFTHFVQVPFTGLGLNNGFRGNEWLKNRIDIFKEYTLRSLLQQSDRNFTVWFQWRQEEETNPLVKEFREYLEETGLKIVHTFGGVTFWDDKYSYDVAYKRLMISLLRSLPKLAPYIENFYVLLTLQPSDDCYNINAIRDIKEAFQKSTAKAIGYRDGYIMNYQTKEIAEYITQTIPPFFTILFSKDEFLDPLKHLNHIGPYKSHEYIADHLEFSPLKGRGFIVGTHGANISTTWNHVYKGKSVSEDILYAFGIYYSKPIFIKKTWRIKAREVLNNIPFHNVLRRWYHKLPPQLHVL